MINEACIFCKIVAGEIPAVTVYEDHDTMAFMDINPIRAGHVTIISKTHISYFFQLDDHAYQSVMATAKKIGTALNQAFHPARIGLIVEGFEIDHFHVKVTPLLQIRDLKSIHEHVTQKELDDTAQIIKQALL